MTTEAKWSARVEAWRASGLSAPAFCAGRDFSASGLRYWASKLRRQGVALGSREVRIARVLRTDDAAAAETPIVIEVGGARLGVRRGFDRDTLRALVEILSPMETER